MRDDTCAELVGGTLEAEAYQSSSWTRVNLLVSDYRDYFHGRGFDRGETFFLLLEACVIGVRYRRPEGEEILILLAELKLPEGFFTQRG